jgi:hypothetical protein
LPPDPPPLASAFELPPAPPLATLLFPLVLFEPLALEPLALELAPPAPVDAGPPLDASSDPHPQRSAVNPMINVTTLCRLRRPRMDD